MRRKRVFKEGQLHRTAQLFIGALLHNRPANMSVTQFMEEVVFHVKTRFIFQCKARRGFQVGGVEFKEGTRFLLRHDTTRPNLYEFSKLSDSDKVISVGKDAFRHVKPAIEVTDKNRFGVEKVFG